MKKNKLKALVRSARKATIQTIKSALLVQLTETAEKLGVASKKTTKELEKTAKNLAKKLAAGIKVDKDALAAATEAKEVTGVKDAPVAAVEPAAVAPKSVKVAKPKAEKVTA